MKLSSYMDLYKPHEPCLFCIEFEAQGYILNQQAVNKYLLNWYVNE